MPTGANAQVVGGKMYLFGGYYQHTGQSNSLYVLDLKTFTWADLSDETAGEKPSGRDKLGSWVKYNKIIYFGGFGCPPENSLKVSGEFTYEDFSSGNSHGCGWNNHLFSLDTVKMQWKQPKCSGDIPCPRAAFASAQIGMKGYLFGGRYKDERRNDLYMIDLHSYKWRFIEPKGKIYPCGRSWNIMASVSDKHLFIYGGFDNVGVALRDVWLFHLDQETWSEIPNASTQLGCFAPRLWHTSCATDMPGEIVIFGGCSNFIIESERTVHTNTIAIYRFSPQKLQRLCIDYIMQHSERYLPFTKMLPRSIQRDIDIRCHALGLNNGSGLGRLVNNCTVM